MTADVQTARRAVPQAHAPETSTLVSIWLFVVAAFVFAMVVVGGATRLTGSGLSITEWKPITGALPPLNDAAWADAFAKYRASSQYRLINQGLPLNDFKVLFWWEWGHRLLGRSIGFVFAVPFITLLAFRRIPRRLTAACVLLFGLGGLQGLVGWWMVASGLEGRSAVAPERLATHLGVALLLFVALVWTALEAVAGPAAPAARSRARVWTHVLTGLVYLQCLMGALVAGSGAGRINGDWPMMSGRWFPADYWNGGLWSTLAHSLAAVQFNHRILAYLIWGLSLALTSNLLTKKAFSARGLTLALFAAISVQAVLGVAALLNGDPLTLALIHQGNAVVVLGLCVTLMWRLRRVDTV